ncbi:serine/threonine protein kinase [Roseobacter sp. YSTF-M11]|uniref:Serine/threonine protein kinase n=1 Tax=Roseobacter insulae TaxID=2859783 RepID=A0A9X1FZV4_9RHOB|nr:serine/threonine-protein kinase [Roseobacter insulae]MBW4710080.1 serine/threonine protein kinase [Roseobacter insulae]
MSIHEGILADEVNSEALAPGSQLLSGQYEIIRYLSSGGFGITYLAKDSLNRTVVIKECFPEAFCSRVNKTVRARTRNYVDDFRSIVALFIREAHALSRLNHSSVVGVHQVFEYNETAYMALDLIDGKDLLEIIESGAPRFSPAQVRSLTLSLLEAIAHVHSQDLLHRDISPDNILVDTSGRPVLIDFGAAREEASRKSRVLSAVLVVKDGYSPQEFYVAGSQQYPSSDLYAFAASLTHLITGNAPPNSQARLAALAANQPDLYEPLLGRFPEYDDAFLAAIDTAMNIVPSERIQSAEDWILMIDHSKRVEIARAKARDDETINLTISKLIKTASVDFEPQAPADVPKTTIEAKPEPAVVKSKSVDPKYDEAFFRDLYDTEDVDGSDAGMSAADDSATDAGPSDDLLAHRDTVDVVPDGSTETETDPDRPGGLVPEKVSITPAAVVKSKSRVLKDNARRPASSRSKLETVSTPRSGKQLPEVLSQKDMDALVAAEKSIARSSYWRRLATIPVILVAYFLLGHTALQFDNIHAVTVGQIITLGEDYGYWTINQSVVAGG